MPYSSLFHELGHNFSLNTPAAFHYGGRIDGPANAIYSEAMAQIFQHATAYELINGAGSYGLPEDVVVELKRSAIDSMRLVRNSYDNHVASGMPFSSWNDPITPQDETFETFMTIAYQFFVHAEQTGVGYRPPLKRMMQLLEGFNEDWQARYDQFNNTPEANTFRATLMVAAISHAFSMDLRQEFRDLGFPVSDAIHEELIIAAQGSANLVGNPSFEDGLSAWHSSSELNPADTASFVADGAQAVSGALSARGTDTNPDSLGRLYQDVTATTVVGHQYVIGGWIRTQDVSGAVVIALACVNAAGWTPSPESYVMEAGHLSGTND